jgi:predicted Zn-dependent protease
MLLTPNVGHVDLTIDGRIEGRGPMAAGPAYSQLTPTGSEAQRAYEPYVLNFLAAFLARDADSRADGLAFLSRAPEESVPGWKMTLEHRPAAPASITHDEFVAAVVAGRSDEAISKLRAVAAVEPNHILLNEAYLQRLSANLLATWGLGKEAIPVIEFMLERYPSPGAQALLAEAHIVAGNYQAATDIYNRFVEQYPNNSVARSRLEWLRSGRAEGQGR